MKAVAAGCLASVWLPMSVSATFHDDFMAASGRNPSCFVAQLSAGKKHFPVTAVHRQRGSCLNMSGEAREEKTAEISSRTSNKSRGVYVRPSAAIERGSGFFIPGLEGGRVRLVVGGVVWCLLIINQSLSTEQGGNVTASNYIAALYGSLLLLQAAIASVTNRLPSKEPSAWSVVGDSSGPGGLKQKISSAVASPLRMQWAALTFLSLTPATHALVIRRDEGDGETQSADGNLSVLYAVGRGFLDPFDEDSLLRSGELSSTLDAVFQLEDGRMTLPENDPATAMLLPPGHQRSVISQRIPSTSGDVCIVVGSDQPLASYTTNDLRWLERLVYYIGQENLD